MNNWEIEYQKSQSIKDKKKQNRSKVLYITIYDPLIFDLTNDLIYSVFNKFGKVSKVLIFEKGEKTSKFFVQFFTLDESEKAKVNLQGTMFYKNYCKMHIYYSNLGSVDLKNKNSLGKDYSQKYSQKNNQNNNILFEEISKTTKKVSDDFQLTKLQKYEQLDFSKYKSRTDQRQLQKDINTIRKQEFTYKQKTKIQQKRQYEQTSIYSLQKIHKKIHYSQYQNKSQLNKPTQMISFSIEQKIPLIHVYNLFSNYGNITKIVMKNMNIYIQFTNSKFAIIATDYLQNIPLHSNILRLTFSHSSQILQKNNQYSQRINFDHTFHRYDLNNPHKSISLNTPSKTLYITNLNIQLSNITFLTQLFQKIAKVQKIQVQHQNQNGRSVLAKFKSIQESIKILVNFHNKQLSGKKINILFSNLKI